MEDDALIRAFQSGETGAFDHLVLRYQDKIFSLCYWYLGDYHEADDAAQDIFLKAYSSLGKFRRESSFSTWLHRIAVNTCKNKCKSLAFRFRKKTESIDSYGDAPGIEHIKHSGSGMADTVGSPADLLEQKEKMKHIRRAIEALAPGKRTLVVLRDIEGLSYEELAAVTGLKLGTVKSKLARARADLVEKLRGIL